VPDWSAVDQTISSDDQTISVIDQTIIGADRLINEAYLKPLPEGSLGVSPNYLSIIYQFLFK
jgi:hypothetical protein